MAQQYFLTFFLVIGFATSTIFGHPAFQHQFNSIVNSNPCLKRCMDKATESGAELSLLKTSNISGFLLDLDNICSIITSARECIDGCGVASNPFALESMNVICTEDSKAEAKSVAQCLSDQGEPILEKCNEECGSYDEINDEVHKLTEAFRPDQNRPDSVKEIMTKISEACTSLKCSDRCTVKELSERCPRVNEGMRDVGAVAQSLVQRILAAQRRDLDRMKLVDTLAHSTPKQCAYMYIPEVMFDPSKDQVAHSVIVDEIPVKEVQRITGDEKKSDLNLALSQLQTQLLKKQMELIDMQERNLMRESQKLDIEMDLLAKKRARFANGPFGFFKQF